MAIHEDNGYSVPSNSVALIDDGPDFDILFSAKAEKIKSSMQSYRSNHACKGPSNLAIWHWQSGNPAWEDWGNCAGTELGAG